MSTAPLHERVLATADALHRALTKASDASCWLLVDPTIRPLADDDLLTQALVGAEALTVQLSSPHALIDRSVMPLIALLDSARAADSEALRVSIEEAVVECEPDALAHGGSRRIGGWLQTDASAADLARYLSRRTVHKRPDGRTTFMRWSDPAVLWSSWSVLNAEQRSALLGPLTRHHLLDPAGRLVVLCAPPRSRQPTAVDAENLALTARQWQLLDSIGPLNRALLESGFSSLPADRLAAARDDGLDSLMRARALGFVDKHDLASFALRAMTVHPRFERHPLVARRLTERQVDDHFTALVDDLTDADWSRITAEAER